MAAVNYRYELRRGNTILATGHLATDEQLNLGHRLTIAGYEGTVNAIEPLLGTRTHRLVIQTDLDETPQPAG